MNKQAVHKNFDQAVRKYKEFLSLSENTLPKSARVDMLMFLIGLKKALRTQSTHPQKPLGSIVNWVNKQGYLCHVDKENYIFISSDPQLLDEVIRLDHSFEPHAKELGALLSYPNCCSERISKEGEFLIDAFENELIKQPFHERFWLINPITYREGKSFISHVPCSSSCINSLNIAEQFWKFLLKYKNESVFKPWFDQVRFKIKGFKNV